MLSSKVILPFLIIVQSKGAAIPNTDDDFVDDDFNFLQTDTFDEGYEENYGERNFGNLYVDEVNGIEDEWIVVMKETKKTGTFSANDLEVVAFDVAKKTGSSIKVMNTYTSALQGFTVHGMTKDAARMFTKDKRVDFVEQNAKVWGAGVKAKTWGLDRIDEKNLPMDDCYAPLSNRDGSGVTAYIIDSGIRTTHNEFKNASGGSRVRWGTNTVGDGKNYDCNGHGTHVAGTVGGRTYGVAPNVNLVAVKVMDCNGDGTKAKSIAGIEWVMNDAQGKKATANLSIGGDISAAQDEAVRNLHNSGVPTVVSAGNDNTDACDQSPAREAAVITVGSTGKASCGGSCVSGNTGILSKTDSEAKESITQVRNLRNGDIVRGFDSNMKPTSCKVEAIGSFGTGEVYGNYTSDHFVYKPDSGKIEEHGEVGNVNVVDKYDLIADCPLIEDESGVKFGPMDSDFCGGNIKDLSWKDYLLLHKAILRVVRNSGTFWFQLSSYRDMATVRKYAPSVCKSMLSCMKDQKMCNHLEQVSDQFIGRALTDSAKAETLKTFSNIGSFNEKGSVSAVITGGTSIGAPVSQDSFGEYEEEEYVEITRDFPSGEEDKRSCFSNHGSCLDIFAPGSDIRSAGHNSDSATAIMGGTSMAAPHVCGAVALHLQNGSIPSAIKGIIINAATKNKVEDAKSGSPNLLLYIGGGTACGGGSCISGNTGILSKPKGSVKESITQVRDLQVGDTVRGLDFNRKSTSCKVEAVGSFGIGEVYGNYTADHFIYNPISERLEEHGKVGILNVTDKYDLIADCPLVEDESGTKFGPMDSDFCGGEIKNLDWKDYLLLHKAILRVVRKTGSFWFQSSSYKDMVIVKKFAPRVCKHMLKCMKNNNKCKNLEKSSRRFVDKALTDSAKAKTLKTFTNLGFRCEMDSVSAVITSGRSVDESLIGTAAC